MPVSLSNFVELHSFVDILLRVPSVFVMDTLLHSSLTFPSPGPPLTTITNEEVEEEGLGQTGTGHEFTEFNDWNLSHLGIFSIKCLGFLVTFIIFTLHTKTLIQVYKWLAAIFAVAASYWTHSLFLDMHLTTAGYTLTNFGHHFFLQTVLATVFYLFVDGGRTARNIAVTCFIAPCYAAPFLEVNGISGSWRKSPLVPAALGLAYVGSGLVVNIQPAYASARATLRSLEAVVRRHGLHVFLEVQWLRLKVPHVLRLFWLVRLSEHVVFRIAGAEQIAGITADELVEASKALLVQGCDTIVAVLGMTSVVASGAHYLSCAIQQFLVADDDDEKSFGTVSAILFFILALQTGLTGLEPEKRFTRLYRNFCLLSTAILHFVHNMVNPLLLSLSASRNRSVGHHARALSVCAFLIAFPCWFLTFLWRTHTVSTWLLAVSAFSIEVTIKVVISLLIYTLFMIDAYRNAFWERLDDYVYYVRATGNSIEFVFGIFLFFNGAWILLFESGGTIRACMMGIHAYFNIWMQAKAGWKVFMRRRTAVNQINSFQEATAQQLRELNDVCAICYQEMSTARITGCHHYFHALCLRKWLYIQDRCPMCHKALYEMEAEEVPDAEDGDLERAQVENVGEVAHLQLGNRDGSQQRNVLEHEHQD